MVSKHFVPSSSKIKVLLYSFTLFLLFLLLQVIVNKDKNSIDFTTLSEGEIEYRKRFNLMVETVEVDKECTLGKLFKLLYICYKIQRNIKLFKLYFKDSHQL